MDNDNQSFLHVLVDAKSEYTQQLTQILSSPYMKVYFPYTNIQKIFQKIKKLFYKHFKNY